MTVLQPWLSKIPMMQQTVLLTAIRGPDGITKYSEIKMLLRWYRRCILLSAMDGRVLHTPSDQGGGSFTGPSCPEGYENIWESDLDNTLTQYIKNLDAIPHHFQLHFMHAVEILGYKHPEGRIRDWWRHCYCRLVNDMHLNVETEAELDCRLGDTREGWLKKADPATIL